MARMTRAEFEEFVRAAIAENVTASAPCACCGTVEIEGVTDAVAAIGGKFEDADSDAYFEGRDAGISEEIDRASAMQTGGY